VSLFGRWAPALIVGVLLAVGGGAREASADATPPQVKRLLKGGALHYLTKPLNVVEFFTVLDRLCFMRNGAQTRPASERILTEVN